MMVCTAVGNLGSDAELEEERLRFRVASNERTKDGDKTTWVRCTMWGKRAVALAPHLTTGTKVVVVGSLSVGEYEGRDGEKHVSVDMRVDQLEFAGGGKDRAESAPARGKPKMSPPVKGVRGLPAGGDDDDEPPF